MIGTSTKWLPSGLPFYTIWVLWFIPTFRPEDFLSIKIPGLRELSVLDRESFVIVRRFANWAMPIAITVLVALIPWIQPNVYAFQNSSIVDNAALRYVVSHTNVLDYIGYEPMQYSDELSFWGDPNYLESQQDVWAGIISPKTEPYLTMNGSVMDNEVKLMPSVWVPEFHDSYATVYVRREYATPGVSVEVMK